MEYSRNIRQLIGDRIIAVKMFSESQGENDWLDYILTFITLENCGTINFPFSGATDFGTVINNELYIFNQHLSRRDVFQIPPQIQMLNR